MTEISEAASNGIVAQWVAGAAAGLAALAVTLPKVLRGWHADKAAITESGARVDIVQGLRDELDRVRAQSEELARTVEQMQLRLNELTVINARMSTRIGELTIEISDLRQHDA